jgi:hypothetical protein
MAFDLKSFLDDESLTFSDGTLKRCFRMRKWILANAFFLAALGHNWINFPKIASILGVDFMPVESAQSAFTVTGWYLLAQFCLLGYQLRAVYSETLATRFTSYSEILLKWANEREAKLESEISVLNERVDRSTQSSGKLDDVARDLLGQLSLKEKQLAENRQSQIEIQARQAGPRMTIRRGEILLDILKLAPAPLILVYVLAKFGVSPF